MLAMIRGEHADFFTDRGWGRHVDRVDGLGRQHLLPRIVDTRYAVFGRELLGCVHLPAGDSRQFRVRGLLDRSRHAGGDAAGADDSPANRPAGGICGRDRGYRRAGTDHLQQLASSCIDRDLIHSTSRLPPRHVSRTRLHCRRATARRSPGPAQAGW